MHSRVKSRPVHQKLIAVSVAAAVEGVLFAAFLLQPTEHRNWIGHGGGVVVQLVGHGVDTGAAPLQPKPPTLTEVLFDDVRRQMAHVYLAVPLDKSRAPLRTLASFFDENQDNASAAAPVSASADVNKLAQQAAGQLGDPRAQASVPRQPQFDQDGNAVACWGHPPQPIPVKVIVVLDARGVMVGRPVVDRSTGPSAGSDVEAHALQALAGCSPYGPPTIAGTYFVFELDFSKSRDWVRQVGTTEIR